MVSVKSLRTPIIYPGGKSLLLPHLRQIVPAHDYCVDVFGGGAAFIIWDTFRKLGVYNDINSDAVNFFGVLRDSVLSQRLYDALVLTPYSREEYYYCYDNYRTCEDQVERARQWFVATNLGFTHESTNRSFRVARETNIAQALRNHVNDLPDIIEKFRNIVVENLDFRKCLELYDTGEGCLLFCDPPYISNNKDTLAYESEFSLRDHLDLIRMLNDTKADVILCGYESTLYSIELHPSQWSLVKKVRMAAVGNSEYQQREKRIEHIWVKKKQKGTIFDVGNI